jgi:hypothetical protein
MVARKAKVPAKAAPAKRGRSAAKSPAPTKKARTASGKAVTKKAAPAPKKAVKKPAAKPKPAPKKAAKAPPKKAAAPAKKEETKMVKIIKKGSVPVDAECPMAKSCHVYEDNTKAWAATLNQTNIGSNNNKYYII